MVRCSIVLERRLSRHFSTIFICGIFFTLSVLIFMSFCNMPCEDKTYAAEHKDGLEDEELGYWNKHIFIPAKNISTFLIILIMSVPGNKQNRAVIRETWASSLPKEVIMKFVIGVGDLATDGKILLSEENGYHNDLLMLQFFNESYTSLTEKLIESFKWIDKNVHFQFLFKGDEDTFIRVNVLLEELKSKPKNRLYWGFFDGRAHIKTKGKWQEKDWFLCDRYLPYAVGGGYVLSSDLVHYIAINSKVLKVYKSEDVSVGTWLGPLDITRVHDTRFNTEFRSRGCFNVYIVTHKQSEIDMRTLHFNLKETGRLCNQESKYRNSYIYNWKVPPTQCCIRNDSSVP
ncbi:hypothetical protein CHS0354_012344 [Potamilus streckersoni]|uniref:Hexosyltransferase n=1 Tax=Potamilus streckersoni TaxID=2493646 RepID=A0AAE0SK72_9BIVA|nr:hypothetical protein CHS0354_012344 [Potamilus streckersoni]